MNANGGLMGASNALIQNKVDFKWQLSGYAKALETINKDLPALNLSAAPRMLKPRRLFSRRRPLLATKNWRRNLRTCQTPARAATRTSASESCSSCGSLPSRLAQQRCLGRRADESG
jgi:hypothetical protein